MRACAQIQAAVVVLQLASLKIPLTKKKGKKNNLNKIKVQPRLFGLIGTGQNGPDNEKDSVQWKINFQQHLTKKRAVMDSKVQDRSVRYSSIRSDSISSFKRGARSFLMNTIWTGWHIEYIKFNIFH